MAQISYYVLVFLFVFILDISSANKCVKQDPCSCTIDDYSFISLSKLHPSNPKELFFEDGKDNVVYFFAGCVDKQLIPKDHPALIFDKILPSASLIKCNSTINRTNPEIPLPMVNQTCTPIGYAKEIQFDSVAENKDQYQLVYVNKSSNNNSYPRIRLVCDTLNPTGLQILSPDTDVSEDVLILYSPLVCVQHITHHELSNGSVFCIVFFVIALIYFVLGGFVMYYFRGARGAEVIPNFNFWVSLPGLMKDGLIYIMSGCRPFTVSTAETYDRI